MKRIVLLMLLVGSTAFVTAKSRFIAQAKKRNVAVASRNETKESFGSSLQSIATTQASLQHQVGLFMMRSAALQQVVVRQGSNLLEDAAPFDSISTSRLSRATAQSNEKVRELQELLVQADKVNNELLSIVRLEDDA